MVLEFLLRYQNWNCGGYRVCMLVGIQRQKWEKPEDAGGTGNKIRGGTTGHLRRDK